MFFLFNVNSVLWALHYSCPMPTTHDLDLVLLQNCFIAEEEKLRLVLGTMCQIKNWYRQNKTKTLEKEEGFNETR